VLSPPYDVVLLEGGTNDRAADFDHLRDRVVETVDYVQERLPSARVVLMGAFNPRTHRYDERRNDVDRVLREIAVEKDVPFFSPLSGNWAKGQGPRFLAGDGLHPTAYGYGVMGVRLAAELRNLDLSSR
jgi:lysophospholipase L1-like esterase